MKRLYCQHCKKVTQHVTFNEQVQCQLCGKGNKKPKGFIEGKCKCGEKYYYIGLDIGYCVKCIDAMEK